MFIDENYLAIPKEKQNLYTAHEVCQLKVLYDLDNTYQKFLVANSWVKKCLPNGLVISNKQQAIISLARRAQALLISYLLSPLESLAKHLQLWYMQHHRTSEVISDRYLAFHPKDYTADILASFEERVIHYGAQV